MRERERERDGAGGDTMQQRATGWNRSSDHCSKDTASVHVVPTLTTELLRHPVHDRVNVILIPRNLKLFTCFTSAPLSLSPLFYQQHALWCCRCWAKGLLCTTLQDSSFTLSMISSLLEIWLMMLDLSPCKGLQPCMYKVNSRGLGTQQWEAPVLSFKSRLLRVCLIFSCSVAI